MKLKRMGAAPAWGNVVTGGERECEKAASA
jgi:hypothetical protein